MPCEMDSIRANPPILRRTNEGTSMDTPPDRRDCFGNGLLAFSLARGPEPLGRCYRITRRMRDTLPAGHHPSNGPDRIFHQWDKIPNSFQVLRRVEVRQTQKSR